jgi:hypothetical protein
MKSPAKSTIAILAVVVVSFCIRLFFVVRHEGLLSVDGGAYLLNLHWLATGEQIQDFRRPWLAPGYLLWPFVKALGYDWGIRAFAMVSWLPVLFPFWLLCRKALAPWATALAVTCVCFGWMLAEMFTAGSLPLLAFTPLLFVMWGIWGLAESSGKWSPWKYTFPVILGLPAIVYMNQTTVGIALYLVPVWTVTAIWLNPVDRKASIRWLVGCFVLAGLFSLPAINFYLDVAPGAASVRYPGPWWTVYQKANSVWFYNLFFLPVVAICIWKGSGLIRAIGILLLVSIPISFSFSYDEGLHNIFYRTRYLYTFWFYMGLAWVAWKFIVPHFPKRLLFAPLAFGLAILVAGFLYQVQAEMKLGRMVTEDSQAGIKWLQTQDIDGTIATNSYSMSLFVAALTGHRSPWIQIYDPPRLYETQHKMMVCLVAWTEGCDHQAAIDYLDADYLMVDMIWPAVENEVYEQIPGLSPAYGMLSHFRFNVWGKFVQLEDAEMQVIGTMWDAPEGADPLPWAVTNLRGDWLEPVWQKGQTKIWKVIR